jgi:hypothetical protein
MNLLSGCEFRKNKRKANHKTLTGLKLFLSVPFTYISSVGEFGLDRFANTADKDFRVS